MRLMNYSPALFRRRSHKLVGVAAAAGLILAGTMPGLSAANAAPPPLVTDPAQYVDVFGGTGDGGGEVGSINDFPGPARPFGMVQFSPDTNGSAGTGAAGDWTSGRVGSGYRYGANQIRGFSLTHASQGCSLYGD
ncbi:MAG: hypothetical protein LBJ08_02745, partial [Bifidobacteriaceae bacterium]|nr:hypothetical protein [Bifidobacteriaceae bacterium]